MPDHIHLLLTPAATLSLEKAMQYIKGGFSFRLKSKLAVWQPSFALRRIQHLRDYEAHLHYIHNNPVRAGLCAKPEDYLYSSAGKGMDVDPAPSHLLRQVQAEGSSPATRG